MSTIVRVNVRENGFEIIVYRLSVLFHRRVYGSVHSLESNLLKVDVYVHSSASELER